MDNNLSILGIAKKAGKIAIGEENVSGAVRRGNARLILSASDASERSRRHAAGYGVLSVAVPYTRSELGSVLGMGEPGIAAITDTGFAALFAKKLAQLDAEQYAKTADQLAELEAKLRSGKARKNARSSAPGGA